MKRSDRFTLDQWFSTTPTLGNCRLLQAPTGNKQFVQANPGLLIG